MNVLHNAKSRLPAMRYSAEFLRKISSLRYATQCEIQVKIFWPNLRNAAQRRVDYALCGIMHSDKLRLRTMPHSAESTHIREYLGKNDQSRKYIRMAISDPRRIYW
jgi:hypothetical protein